MLYNNIKLNNKYIFYMSTCCTSFENLGFTLKANKNPIIFFICFLY